MSGSIGSSAAWEGFRRGGRRAAFVLMALLGLFAAFATSARAGEANGIAMIAQQIYGTLEVFYVNSEGGIRWIHKEKNGRWHQPRDLTGPGVAPQGAAILPLWQTQNDQLEVFWVDKAGAVNFFYKDHNKPYSPAYKLTGQGFAMPGAPLAGLWQPRYHHLEVFGIAPDGALSHVYKTDNKKWNAAGQLSGPGFGVPGSRPVAVYQETGGQSQVFAVGPDGAINLIWKAYNFNWEKPFPITLPKTAPSGASLTALYMPRYDQLEVLFADRDGAAVSVYKVGTNIYDWKNARISKPGFAVPGASVSAVYRDSNTFLEVFGIGADGAVNDVYKVGNGRWAEYFRIGEPAAGRPSNAVAAAVEPGGKQLEVVWRDGAGVVWNGWKGDNRDWTRFRMTGPGGLGLVTPGMCSKFFNAWRRGKDDDYLVTECSEIMGINAYCAKQDARPMMTFGGPQGNDRWLVCSPNHRPDSIGEQAEKIARGVREGLNDAFVAASPYLGPAIEAAGCINGVVYACAALALDIAQRTVGDLATPLRLALTIGNDVIACTNGDLLSCITVGKRGYETASGRELPGGNIVQGAIDARDCSKNIFAACVRMGLAAAEVAGVPKGVIPANIGAIFIETEKCLDTLDKDNRDACVDLGVEISQASGVPLGDLVNGALLADRCAAGKSQASEDACFELGKKAAKAAGLPVALATSLAQKSERCWTGETDACLDVAAEAMRATGVNDNDIELIRQCAAREMKACTILAGTASGVRLGDAVQTAEMVSDCQQSSEEACIALAQLAIDKYAPEQIRSKLPPLKKIKMPGGISDIADLAKTVQIPSVPVVINVLPPTDPVVTAPIELPVDPRLAMPTSPAPAAGVSFTGDWVTFVRNGVVYTMRLSQDIRGRVSGDYGLGTISNGVVVDRDLYAVWEQGRASGTVLFHMAPDGTSFAGMWAQDGTGVKPTPSNAKGNWDGYSANVFVKPEQGGEMAGRFELDRGGSKLALEVSLDGDRVSGSYNGGSLSGAVTRRAGRPTEVAVQVTDGRSGGSGSFYLYPDGSGFSGYWHGGAGELNAWSGRLVAAAAAPEDSGPGGEAGGATAVVPDPVLPLPTTKQVELAPVAPLPSGQCPALTARVTTQLNIRDGADGKVIGSAKGGSLVQCIACDKGWCLIAASDPRATVSRRYLDFEAQTPVVRPDPIPMRQVPGDTKLTNPSPAVTQADFIGRWTITTDKGWTYYMRFNQRGSEVTGIFIDQDGNTGRIKGNVEGNVFSYGWDQDDGFAGGGSFRLNGNKLEGSYATNPDRRLSNGDLRGSWGGARSANPAGDFSGPWTITTSAGASFILWLEVDRERVSGTYATVDNSYPGTLSGWIVGNALAYEWQQTGGYSGGGVFVLSGDSIEGPYKNRPHTGLSEGDRAGRWGGYRGISGGGGKTQASPADEGMPVDIGGCGGCGDPREPEHPR